MDRKKYSIILDIMTHLVISKKLDPLADGTIEMVLSKCVCLRPPSVNERRQKGSVELNSPLLLAMAAAAAAITLRVQFLPEGQTSKHPSFAQVLPYRVISTLVLCSCSKTPR